MLQELVVSISQPVDDTGPSKAILAARTAEVKASIADLDDESRVEKMLRVGAAICAAREILPHGSLQNWYRSDVKRSESWCSQYFRLHHDRDRLPDALDWVLRTKHRLAACRGIEHLLRIISDYKVKVLGDDAASRKATRGGNRTAAKTHAGELVAVGKPAHRSEEGFR
jgi:hypothetical protein